MRSNNNPFYDLIPQDNKQLNNPFSDLIPATQPERKDTLVKIIPGAQEFVKKLPGAASQVSKDIGNVASQIPGTIIRGIGNIPRDIDYLKENIPLAGEQLINDPSRAGRNALAGAAELGGQISRIPPALADYLVRIGMMKPETAAYMPRPFSEQEVEQFGNKLVGENISPGDELIRGAIRNAPAIYGGTKIIQALNPLKYTSKNIAKDVINAREKQKLLHTNEYNKIWEKAEKQGFNTVHFDPNKINLDLIKQYSTEKYYGALEKFINDPVLKNAQKAQSDLGKLINSPTFQKSVLTSEEQATLKAAQSAQNYIKDKMFRNKSGEINLPLKHRYETVTKSYEKNVIPYTTNKAINEFRKGDLLAEELIPKLSRGKFAAKKGAAHPEIARRKLIKPIIKGAVGLEVAHLLGLDRPLIDKLLSRE